MAPSGANCQPVEFVLVTDPEVRRQVFANTAWGGRVRPRRTPVAGQEPTAWVVVLLNSQRGPVTAHLQEQFLGIARGELEDRFGWMTLVEEEQG